MTATLYTREELETKTGPQLVAIFNEIQDQHPDGQRVKRFASRDAGINRILTVQEVQPDAPSNVVDPKDVTAAMNRADRAREAGEPEPVPVAAPEPQDSTEDSSEDEVPSKRRGRKPLPRGTYNLEGGPTKRPYRANSGRGRLLAILTTDGSTFEDLLPHFPQWDRDQVHNTIRMCARWLGFTITTDDNGVIRATR